MTKTFTFRIASVVCGASDAFLHPRCASSLSGVEYHDLTREEMQDQDLVYCDGCGERFLPFGQTMQALADRTTAEDLKAVRR